MRPPRRADQARLRLVLTDGSLSKQSFARLSRIPAAAKPVHRKKIVRSQLLAFPLNRDDNRVPCIGRDAASLLPLTDLPMTFANGLGHLGQGIPHLENIANGFHAGVITWDNLSRQGKTTRPVTASRTQRTIRPMGKATTPTAFKKEFCQRLKAARIMAGLDQAEVAQELGLLLNTYNKYETRSLLPHYLIPRACEILGIEPDVLFLGPKEVRRKTG